MHPIIDQPKQSELDFWIHNNLNVLFYGRHGVGKTSIILDAFKRNNINYMTFSAATMDPWVDFIGVPKEMTDEKGSYLSFVQPKSLRDNEVQAIFLDELNRSHKKVRNAVMELIQFKSINGKVFPNLRFIWAAVNPSDDTVKYDVEELDAAQADRFQVHVEIPYKPCSLYFRQKYGRQTADAAIDWWHDLPKEMQLHVSPRRLEYAIQIASRNGNIAFALPPQANVIKLSHALQYGSPVREYNNLLKEKNEEKIRDWLSIENNYVAVVHIIAEKPEDSLYLLPHEKIVSMISKFSHVSRYVFENYVIFKEVIRDLASNSTNNKLQIDAVKCITLNDLDYKLENKQSLFKNNTTNKTLTVVNASLNNFRWNEKVNPHYSGTRNKKTTYRSFQECLAYLASCGEGTPTRMAILNSLCILTYLKSDSLTEQESTIGLQMIENICSRTQNYTLRHCDNLYYAVAKLVMHQRSEKKINTYKDFALAYPNIADSLYIRGVKDIERSIDTKNLPFVRIT